MNLMRRNNSASFPSLIEEFFNEPFVMVAPVNQQQSQSLALDVSENEKEVIVRASVPGFTKEQVNIEVHDDILTIKAEKSEETEEKNERFVRRERRQGSLIRSISLPTPVAEDKARADLKDGILTLSLPKNPKVLPRRISIN